MRNQYDAVIVGGGHNGLVTAAYLARAGRRPLVVERRSMVGGACVTEEPWPGFRINTFSYACGLLRPRIVEELELSRFGYDPILCDPQLTVPLDARRALTFWVHDDRTAKEIRKFSARDAERWPEYVRYWRRFHDWIEPHLLESPGALARFLEGGVTRDVELWLQELFLRSAAEFLDDWFESEEVKGALASGAIIGTFAGPRTPGTAYILGHHTLGVLGGHHEVWGYARGGMGRITEAIAGSAQAHGAEILTGVGVTGINVEEGTAKGVTLSNGREILAPIVASSIDVKKTVLELLPREAVDAPFRSRVEQVHSRGACLKLNAALKGVPNYVGIRDPSLAVGAVDISPSIDYLERAFDDAKYGAFSSHPFVDIYHQSLLDPSVAPQGRQTMTCFVQYAPSELRGRSWDDACEEVVETILATLEDYAPGIRSLLLHHQLVTPTDIERILGMTGGNIDQGDITPDQIFSLRPIPGWADYRLPVRGLYLCGSTAHPGGGVTGAPGFNAAQAILADLKPPD